MAAFLLLIGNSRSEACSCMPPGPPAEEFTRADAVFVGKVIRIDPDVVNDQFSSRQVTLLVQRAYRGSLEQSTVVTTAASSAACGFNFSRGEEYVVYAHADQEGLNVSLCSRTAGIANASEDLRFFADRPQLPMTSGSSQSITELGLKVLRLGLAGWFSLPGRDK